MGEARTDRELLAVALRLSVVHADDLERRALGEQLFLLGRIDVGKGGEERLWFDADEVDPLERGRRGEDAEKRRELALDLRFSCHTILSIE